jgi:hypothetical protein
MADWLKDIQSIGRGIRNGEMSVVVASSRSGKSVIVDYESQGIEPTFKSMYGLQDTYWCHNPETDRWTFHKNRPYYEYITGSDQIIARNEDGTYYWYKDRESGRNHELTEEELKSLLFVFLGAEEVVKKAEWVDVSKLRHADRMISIK